VRSDEIRESLINEFYDGLLKTTGICSRRYRRRYQFIGATFLRGRVHQTSGVSWYFPRLLFLIFSNFSTSARLVWFLLQNGSQTMRGCSGGRFRSVVCERTYKTLCWNCKLILINSCTHKSHDYGTDVTVKVSRMYSSTGESQANCRMAAISSFRLFQIKTICEPIKGRDTNRQAQVETAWHSFGI